MKSIFLGIFLLCYSVIAGVIIGPDPYNGTVYKYNVTPSVDIVLGESALNKIINNYEIPSLFWSTNVDVSAKTGVDFFDGNYHVFIKLDEVTLDFEEGEATVSLDFVTSFSVASEQVSLPFSFKKTLHADDLSYEISAKKIKLALNKFDEWHAFVLGLDVPDFVRTALIDNASEVYILNRNMILGELNKYRGLDNVSIYTEEKSITIGFGFEDDFLRLSVEMPLEGQAPAIWMSHSFSTKFRKGFTIRGNATYKIKSLKLLDTQGRVRTTFAPTDNASREHWYLFPNDLGIVYDNLVGVFYNDKQVWTVVWRNFSVMLGQHENNPDPDIFR